MKGIRIIIVVSLLMAVATAVHAVQTFTVDVNGYPMTFSVSDDGVYVGTTDFFHSDSCIPQTAQGTISIPSTVVNPNDGQTYQVTGIAHYAFEGCKQLTEVIIPSTVNYIGGNAFNGCTGITTIHLPASLEYLSGEAFFGMSSLSAITVDADNPFFWAEDGVLYFIDSDGVTSLYRYPQAKAGHYFHVPEGVERIMGGAFAEVKQLWSCILPEGVTSIGFEAFMGSSINRCSMPESLEEIGESAYSNTNIESVHIPFNVSYIDDGAFANCAKLRTVTMSRPPVRITVGDDAFNEIHPKARLVAPPSIVRLYQNYSPWKDWFNEIIGGYVIDKYNFGDLLSSYLSGHTEIDADNNDILTPEELDAVTTLDMGGWDTSATSVKGLELFTNLEYLSCAETYHLASIDVTKNTKLKRLNVYNCTDLTSLNVAFCPLLEELYCNDCSLSGELELGNGVYLKEVWCDGNNLTKLNLFTPSLEVLHCEGNSLTTLDVSSCFSLKELYCYGNSIGDAAMTTLVNGLPDRNGMDEGLFSVFLDPDYDNNVCSVANVAMARAKNWGVYDGYMDPFEGENTSGVATAISEASPLNDKGKMINDKAGWYSLDGIMLSGKPAQSGVYLFNGRKVVIK